MTEQKPVILTISKLDAARRQLQTAITLWFSEGDPVSIHTLAFAAYEVIHWISKRRNPHRRDLLLDSDHIKEEYRKDWNVFIRKHANFFKHSDRDGDATIEFRPILSDLFIMMAITGWIFVENDAMKKKSHSSTGFRSTNPITSRTIGVNSSKTTFQSKASVSFGPS